MKTSTITTTTTITKDMEDNAMNTEKLDKLFDELVPNEGKADTLAGETVRAVSRINYRWINDGDMINLDYGKETCNPAARFLKENTNNKISDIISDIWDKYMFNKEYDNFLQELNKEVISYLEEHPELKTTVNDDDMLDYAEDTDFEDDYDDYDDDYDDYDDDYDEDDDYDDYDEED